MKLRKLKRGIKYPKGFCDLICFKNGDIYGVEFRTYPKESIIQITAYQKALKEAGNDNT